MTAGEDELESLVGKCRRVHGVLHCLRHVEQAGLRGEGAVAANAIDGAVARRRDQPGARVGGTPSRGQRSAAIAKASCAASSARSKSPRKPISAARTRPHWSRKTCSRTATTSTIGRTSIAPLQTGRRDPRGQLDRGVEVVGLEQEVAADRLLDLGERAVGGQRLAVLHAHRGRRLEGADSSRPRLTPGVS